MDEFAHLKWAYELFSGKKPYIDFLSFFPPGYHWFLSNLFFFGKGVTPLQLGRLGEFGVFGGLVGATIWLFWMVRRNLWAAILAGALLAFLPLPFDKFLEMRPDTLATLLVVIGVIGEIRWMREGRRWSGVLSGVAYAFSLLVLPKMLPNVIVGIIIAIASAEVGTPWFSHRQGPDRFVTNKGFFAKAMAMLRKGVPPRAGKAMRSLSFLVGIIIPLFLFGIWCLTLGKLDLVIYSLTKLPFESNKISQIFFMGPDLFFYPNQIFYGIGGWSRGLVVNHVLWIVGWLIGIYRFITGGIDGLWGSDGKKRWIEFLIAGNFIVQIIFYVSIVPLKHSQYLIPIAVFVAWYVADGVLLLSERFGKYGESGRILFAGVFLLGAVFLYQVNLSVETPKLSWTNREDLESLKKLYTTIPTSEYILDLDGRTLYYKDPYYACCIPFGQFAPYLSRPLPPLSQALEQTNTKYIFEGGLKRVGTLLPEDQAYIASHFTQTSEIPGLLKRTK